MRESDITPEQEANFYAAFKAAYEAAVDAELAYRADPGWPTLVAQTETRRELFALSGALKWEAPYKPNHVGSDPSWCPGCIAEQPEPPFRLKLRVPASTQRQ